jgi:hypothetical protein
MSLRNFDIFLIISFTEKEINEFYVFLINFMIISFDEKIFNIYYMIMIIFLIIFINEKKTKNNRFFYQYINKNVHIINMKKKFSFHMFLLSSNR